MVVLADFQVMLGFRQWTDVVNAMLLSIITCVYFSLHGGRL